MSAQSSDDEAQTVTEMEMLEAFEEPKNVSHVDHGEYETVDVSFPVPTDGCSMVIRNQIPEGWDFDQVSGHGDTDTMMLTLIRGDY